MYRSLSKLQSMCLHIWRYFAQPSLEMHLISFLNVFIHFSRIICFKIILISCTFMFYTCILHELATTFHPNFFLRIHALTSSNFYITLQCWVHIYIYIYLYTYMYMYWKTACNLCLVNTKNVLSKWWWLLYIMQLTTQDISSDNNGHLNKGIQHYSRSSLLGILLAVK